MIAARQIFLGRGGAKLPYDAEVEYLESTGTQYIDTGVVGDSTTTFEAFVYRNTKNTNECAIGSYGGGNRCWLSYFFSNKYYLGYGGHTSTTVSAPSGAWLTEELKIESGVANLYVGGVSIESVMVSAFSTGQNLFIGAMNSNGSPNYHFKGRLGYVKIYKYSVLVRDMIPVRVGGVGYMYDRVSKQLFRNQGTGEFLYGRDTNPISARSYVQDGLIAMWDGIENAGWGVHDANETTWKDLIGDCDGTAYNVSWSDNSAIFNGTSTRFDLANRDPFASNTLQAEFVISLETPYQASTVFTSGGNGVQRCATISTSAAKIVTKSRIPGNSDSGPLWPIDLTHNFFSIQYDLSGSVSAYDNGISVTSSGTGGVDDGTTVAKIGARNANNSYGQYMKGRIFNLRLYSRALTSDEIAANYAVDKARFNIA